MWCAFSVKCEILESALSLILYMLHWYPFTNECHFLASVDIRWKCVSCPFHPLTGRSSLGNLRCLFVLLFSFVNVIRFSCVKVIRFSCVGLCGIMRHSCDRAFTNINGCQKMSFVSHLMRWPIRHSCDRAFNNNISKQRNKQPSYWPIFSTGYLLNTIVLRYFIKINIKINVF